jgi:rubrerythrin
MHLAPSSNSKQAWKATGPAAGFYDAYSAIISSLGAYPHAALSLAEKPKQATRMLKAACPTCGYTVRLTQKWASLSLPICGTDGESFILETGETA